MCSPSVTCHSLQPCKVHRDIGCTDMHEAGEEVHFNSDEYRPLSFVAVLSSVADVSYSRISLLLSHANSSCRRLTRKRCLAEINHIKSACSSHFHAALT